MKADTRFTCATDLSAKGFYSVLAILTLLSGGLIFLAYGWYPYVLRTSRLHLQAVVDDLCSHYARFLPLDPSNNFLGQLLINPQYVLRTQQIAGQTQIPATLASMQRLVNLGEVQLQLSVVAAPDDTSQTGDIQQVELQNFAVDFTLGNELDSVEFVVANPNQEPLFRELPGLNRLFHDGNTLICTGQITLNQGLFTFLLPWLRDPQVITAVAGVTRVPHNVNGFEGGVILLLENTAPVTPQNRQQILARNSFAASLAHLISRSGVFRDRLRVAVVDPRTLNQGQISAQIIKDLGESGLVARYQGAECNDDNLQQVLGSAADDINNYLDQILRDDLYASSIGPLAQNCTNSGQMVDFGFSVLTLGFQGNTPTLTSTTILNLFNTLRDPVIIYLGFNFPVAGFMQDLLGNTNSPVHVVLFPAQIISQSDLEDISTILNADVGGAGVDIGAGFGFRQNGQIFSFQSRRNNRLRFTLTIFDACSALDFGANQPLPVDVELNFNVNPGQNAINQATCRQNPNQVFGVGNPGTAYLQLLINSNQVNLANRRDNEFRNMLNQPDQAQFDPLFENWPHNQPLFFPYAYRFYATRLFLREEFGWMY